MASILNNSVQASPVYGFLCEESNVFYAFESFQEYQGFLSLLKRESAGQTAQAMNDVMTDEELR